MKWIAYAMSALCIGSPVAIAETTATSNELRQSVDELDNLWVPTDTARQRQYFVRVGELAANFAKYDQSEAATAALEMLSSTLDKMPATGATTDAVVHIRTADLGAIDNIALFLFAEGNSPFGSQSLKVKLVSRMLGRIRAEEIQGFAPKRVQRNVSPPPGSAEIWVTGMDPKAIEDPKDRAIYEAAIRENSQNKVLNQRQERLQRLDADYAKQVVALLRRVSVSGDISSEVIRQAIEQARLTADEKATIGEDVQ